MEAADKIAILSLILAMLVAGFTVWNELKKMNRQRAQDQLDRAETVFSELHYLGALIRLIDGEQYLRNQPTIEALQELRFSFERLVVKLLVEPKLHKFLLEVKFEKKVQRDLIFLMLGDSRMLLAKAQVTFADLLRIRFAVLTLMYLYEDEAERQERDSYATIMLMATAFNDQFSEYLVEATTPSFRSKI